jgi:hypothetical protein
LEGFHLAHLEHVLDLIIWDLAGIDASRVACITAQLIGSRPRYQAIILLLKERNAENLAKEADELMRRCSCPSSSLGRLRSRTVGVPGLIPPHVAAREQIGPLIALVSYGFRGRPSADQGHVAEARGMVHRQKGLAIK